MKALRLLAIAALVVLAACSPAKTPMAGANGLTPIRFATDWRAQAEQGGFYQALATGEYRKRGLDVSIIQGGPAVNVPLLLATGAIDLGIGSNSFIALKSSSAEDRCQGGDGLDAERPAGADAPTLIPEASVQSADMKGQPIRAVGQHSITAIPGSGWKAKYGFTDSQIRPYTILGRLS